MIKHAMLPSAGIRQPLLQPVLPGMRPPPAVRQLLCALCLLPGLAMAQQAPLTGQMLDGPDDTAPTRNAPQVPAAASSSSSRQAVGSDEAAGTPTRAARPEIGDTTRALLRMQASGEQAAPPLPILGDQATLSYTRYLKSFEHPIPEYLETNVRKAVSGNGTGE